MLQSHYARPPPPSPASLPHEAALACDCRTPDPRTTTTNHPNVTKFRYRISAEHRTPHNIGTPHKTHTKKSELHAVPKRPSHPKTLDPRTVPTSFIEWRSQRATVSAAALIGTVRTVTVAGFPTDEDSFFVIDPVRPNAPALVVPSKGSSVSGVLATLVTRT